MRSAQFLLTIVITGACIHGQTRIDLTNQARNIDFSVAQSTKPAKTGIVLPSICTTGELFFKTDAPTGRNLYGCSATNLWSLQAATMEAAPAEFVATASPQQVVISPGTFRFGATATPIRNTGTITLTGTASGTVWVGATPAGVIIAAHNRPAGSVTVTGDRYTVTDGATGFPAGSIPIYQCPVIAGVFGICTDYRASIDSDPVAGGPSGTINVNCEGSPCTVDVEPTAVPTLSGTNVFTGLNTFSQMKLPVVSALATTDCDEASEVGTGVVLSTGATGQQWYVCEQTGPGTFAWHQQGGAGVGDGDKGDITVSNSGATWTVDSLLPDRVGLGNVQNYGTCSQAQAQAGAATDCNMTAERTAQAIAAQAKTSDGVKGDITVSNAGTIWTVNALPPGRVGLGNVQNYGTCSQAQAQAGSATDCNMTAERTAQAIAAQAMPNTYTETRYIPWLTGTGGGGWSSPASNNAGSTQVTGVNGSPRRWAMTFAETATQSIAYFGRIPEDAVTSGNRITNIGMVVGANDTAGGNYRFVLTLKCFADNEDSGDGTGMTTLPDYIIAAPTTARTSVQSNKANPAPASCTEGKTFWVNISRVSGDALDSATNTALLHYLRIDFARTR